MRTIDLTYKLIHFPKQDRWVAVAWNYDEAVLVSSKDQPSYTAARGEVAALLKLWEIERNVEYRLRWFDGEYTCAGENEQLWPKTVV